MYTGMTVLLLSPALNALELTMSSSDHKRRVLDALARLYFAWQEALT